MLFVLCLAAKGERRLQAKSLSEARKTPVWNSVKNNIIKRLDSLSEQVKFSTFVELIPLNITYSLMRMEKDTVVTVVAVL